MPFGTNFASWTFMSLGSFGVHTSSPGKAADPRRRDRVEHSMGGHPSTEWAYWFKLAIQLLVAWAAIFGLYEIIERIYLRSTGEGVLHLLHILRGTCAAFLLAFLGARGVYRRREDIILEARDRLTVEKIRQDKILAELGAGLIVLDMDFRVVYANAQAQIWFGAKIPNTLCAVDECAMGRDKGICPARESVIRQGRISFEEQIETPDGRRYFFITSTSLPDTEGGTPGGIIELIQDVTQLKDMESRLRQTVAAARVGAISSGIAHQLGNPLSSISAALDRLYSLGASKHESYARYLQRIEIDTDRATRIIRSLVDLARRTGCSADPALRRNIFSDVQPVVTAAATAVVERRGNLRNNIKFYWPQTLLRAWISPTDLHEVLTNLIENAADATMQQSSQRISIHAAKERESILIMVCDNGPGLNESVREKIFEPYFTTRREGTGLGLYLCREIVESNNGDIRAENLPAGGARFLIRLPASEIVSAASKATVPA